VHRLTHTASIAPYSLEYMLCATEVMFGYFLVIVFFGLLVVSLGYANGYANGLLGYANGFLGYANGLLGMLMGPWVC